MTRRAWLVRRFLTHTAWMLMLPSPSRAQKFEFGYVLGRYGTVSAIDVFANRVTATIAVAYDPRGIAFSPDGRHAYVTNSRLSETYPQCPPPSTVAVIDTLTNTVVAEIPVQRGPDGIAITPNGTTAYVANLCSGSVSVIDTAANTVTATIDAGAFSVGPTRVATTPNGTAAYVTSLNSGRVMVIDASANRVAGTIDVGNCNSAIAITPDSAFAYVVRFMNCVPFTPGGVPGTGSVAVIDVATNTVVSTGEEFPYFFPSLAAIAPDGTFGYFTNCDQGVCVIDTATRAITHSFAPNRPSQWTGGVAFAKKGAVAYIAAGSVFVIDTATRSMTKTIPVDSMAQDVAVATVQPFVLDHFKCYKAKTAAGSARFQQRTVTLADEFETKSTTLLKPASICNPVDKNGEGIEDATAHVECYKIKDVSGQAKFTPRDVLTQNQFGTETLTARKADTLCVPSEKDGQPSALNLDHFKCYKARTATGAAEFQQRTVSLTDQFETKNTTVVKPVSICNPVDKNGEGIKSSLGHLECYRIKDVRGQPKFTRRDVGVQNQFGTETLTAQKPDTLCVPSLKDEAP